METNSTQRFAGMFDDMAAELSAKAPEAKPAPAVKAVTATVAAVVASPAPAATLAPVDLQAAAERMLGAPIVFAAPDAETRPAPPRPAPPAPAPVPLSAVETVEGLRERYRELTRAIGAAPDADLARLRAERSAIESRGRALAAQAGVATGRAYERVQRQPASTPAADVRPVDATTPLAAPVVHGGQIVAVENADASTGAIVYWHLSGDVQLEALRNAWEAEGLSAKLLPANPGADVALTRAAHELAERHTLVRKHPAGGYAIVRETRTGGTLDYTVQVRVHLTKGAFGAQQLTVTREAAVDAEADRLAERLVAEHKRYMSALASTDVGVWLVRLICGEFRAVALRSTGGIYFVPRANVEKLHAVKRTLARCAVSHVVHEIPAMRSTDTINAILDAVTRETNDEIKAVREAVAEGLGGRAIRTRLDVIAELDRKVASYGALLGSRIAPVRAKLAALRTALMAVKPGRGALLEID